MSFFPQNIYSLSNSSCLIQIQNFKEHVYRSIRDKQTHLLKATSSKGPLTQSAITIVLSRLSLCLPVSLVLAFYQPWLALISDDSFSTLSPLNVWQLNFRSRLLFSPLPFSSSFISSSTRCRESSPDLRPDFGFCSNITFVSPMYWNFTLTLDVGKRHKSNYARYNSNENMCGSLLTEILFQLLYHDFDAKKYKCKFTVSTHNSVTLFSSLYFITSEMSFLFSHGTLAPWPLYILLKILFCYHLEIIRTTPIIWFHSFT